MGKNLRTATQNTSWYTENIHQSWPTGKWLTPSIWGKCALLWNYHTVQKPPVCLSLALDCVEVIFVSTTIHHTSWHRAGLINNCWIKQTFKKECPHWVRGWTRIIPRFFSMQRFYDHIEPGMWQVLPKYGIKWCLLSIGVSCTHVLSPHT